MALKPVIYKVHLNLSDLNRHLYDDFNLTIALHPSETLERMTARILAFALNANDQLVFTKGLSTTDEPDVWEKSLDDQILQWIEVGEPSPERIQKASRIASAVKVYSFNSKSDTWWSQSENALSRVSAQVYQFNSVEVEALAGFVQRTMKWFVTISEQTLSITTDVGDCEVNVLTLKQPV